MRLAILPCPTDYPLILRSRDSGVSKDRGPAVKAGSQWFARRCVSIVRRGRYPAPFTMRIYAYKQNAYWED